MIQWNKYMIKKRPVLHLGSYIAFFASISVGWWDIALGLVIAIAVVNLIEAFSLISSAFVYVLEKNGLETEFDELDPEKNSLNEIIRTLEN